MEDFEKICATLVQCARLIAKGDVDDARIYLTRVTRNNIKKSDCSAWGLIQDALNEFPREIDATREIKRSYHSTIPLEGSSLVQYEENPVQINVDPIWATDLSVALNQIVLEWNKKKELKRAGLTASKTILFSGPPGVGKTLAAKWIANRLKLPVLTLNLAAVMSSLLGKTGNNIQNVFERAKATPCVLLLDEFDSIAKNRDDLTEVGELKRLVTVLLQEIDNWNENSLLIAATNHQDLLDTAVWRRFDVTLSFGKPSQEAVEKAIRLYLGNKQEEAKKMIPVLKIILQGSSYSDIQRCLSQIRKNALLNNKQLNTEIMRYITDNIKGRDKGENIDLALQLVHAGISQRRASDITGISRDTIRKKDGR